MGYRAHALTKREVEYGNGTFNWNTDTLKKVLKGYCPTSFYGGDEWGDGEDWEVSTHVFKEMLGEIKRGSQEDFTAKTGIEFVGGIDEMTFDDIVKGLETLYEDGKQAKKEFIYISWF